MSSSTATPNLKNACFRLLQQVSPSHKVLPNSYFLAGLALDGSVPYASGRFADTWKGLRGRTQVCVKAFRTQTLENRDKIQRVCGNSSLEYLRRGTQPDSNQILYPEIVVWKYVSHPNVLPFLGVSETLFPFCIISPWMSGGDILEYIQKHRGVNRLQLVSIHHNLYKRLSESRSSKACASCLWSRTSTFGKHHPRRCKSSE